MNEKEKIEFVIIKESEQLKKFAEVAKEIWSEYFPPLISKEQTDYMIKNIQSEEAVSRSIREGYEYYFISVGRAVLGYFAIHEETERLFLSKIYLYKEQRGKGFASETLNHIEKLALNRGKKSVYLYVFKGNENSVAVYKKRGFKIIRDVETDIGGGFILRDFEMEKIL